jgi:circadian clock protein KaiB
MAHFHPDNEESGEKKRLTPGLEKGSAGIVVSLTLFVAGASDRSQRAVAEVKRICEEVLVAGYDLEVIDVYETPDAAREAQIMVAPTLIRKLPGGSRRFSGDFSDRTLVVSRLGLGRVDLKG